MKQLQEDIRSGNFSHVYLLYGEEGDLRQQFRDRLCDAIVPKEDAINRTVYDEDRFRVEELIDQAETLPFFAERRLILVNRSGLFQMQSDELADYLEAVPDYLYLVFSEEKVDKKRRAYKAAVKAGRAVEFSQQDEKTLAIWIARMLGDAGLRIRQSDMLYFLQMAGSDMGTLRRETDKLIHYCAGRETVERADIDAVVTVRTEDRVFEMIRAVTEKRRERALALYADLMAFRVQPEAVLVLMQREYLRLLNLISAQKSGRTPREMASALSMHPYAVQKTLPVARRYSEEQLEAVLALLAQGEQDFKQGRISSKVLVESLLALLSEGPRE